MADLKSEAVGYYFKIMVIFMEKIFTFEQMRMLKETRQLLRITM